MNVAMVATAASAIWRFFPPLVDEPASTFFAPVVLLSIPIAALLHAAVTRTGRSVARAIALYASFVALALVYAIYLWVLGRGWTSVPCAPGEPMLVCLLLRALQASAWVWLVCFAAHVYGAPALLVAGLVNKGLSRWLCPRPDRSASGASA